MDIKETLKSRRSSRNFSSKQVPSEILNQIIDVARYAPTARNIQPWEFIIITDKPTKDSIHKLASKNAPFLKDAPACIAIFCKDTKYYLEDGSAVTTYILLMAHSLGLGSCWVAGDKKEYAEHVREILSLPNEFRLVSLVALGYSQGDMSLVNKRKCEEVVSWQKFSIKQEGKGGFNAKKI